MATKEFELNFQRLYEIDITPEGTATYARIAAGVTSADPALNESTDQTNYLDGNGFGSTDVIAKQFTLAFSGHRVKGDDAQDFILGKLLSLGDDLKTNFRRTDKFGNVVSGACTIVGLDDGGGDAGSKVEIAFEIHFNGQPTLTPASAATALSTVIAVGSAVGTTKATATAGVGNKLGYKLKPATLGTVNGGQFIDGYVNYTSGADIVAAAGQYLCVFEISANERVVKYFEDVLEAADIKA